MCVCVIRAKRYEMHIEESEKIAKSYKTLSTDIQVALMAKKAKNNY